MKCIVFLFLAVTACAPGPTSHSPQTAQTSAKEGGGGDIVSQEFAGAVRRLPETLSLFGWEIFPEIDPERLKAVVNDPELRIELSKGPILVNGVQKDARNFPEDKLIQLDEPAMKQLLSERNSDERLNALALHEILGLMKIEENNDYHISNRLLSKSGTSVTCEGVDTPHPLRIHITFDFFPVTRACLTKADGSPRTCELTYNAGSIRLGQGDLLETESTGLFAQKGSRFYHRNGTLRTQSFVLDDKKSGTRQEFIVNHGSLTVQWKALSPNGALKLREGEFKVQCRVHNG